MKKTGQSIAICLFCLCSLAFWWIAPDAGKQWISDHFPQFSSEEYIAEIQAVSNRPIIAVRPTVKTKQPVLLQWRADKNCWYWTWSSAPDWSRPPDSFFERNGGWWIERNEPKFGKTKETLGMFAQVSSWSFSAGKWQGTGAPPTIELQ